MKEMKNRMPARAVIFFAIGNLWLAVALGCAETQQPIGQKPPETGLAKEEEPTADRSTQRQEEASWNLLVLSDCTSPHQLNGCDKVKMYLAIYPMGRHVTEAKQALEVGSPIIAKLAEEQDWGNAQPETCKALKNANDCDGVSRYLSGQPSGAHVEEARTLLAQAQPRIMAVRETEERRLQSMPPPVAGFMSLTQFRSLAPEALRRVEELSAHGLPDISLDSWGYGRWTSLAVEVKGATDAERYNNFGDWAVAIREAIGSIYREWNSRSNHAPEVREQQHAFFNRWVDKINSMVGIWNSEFRERMERARLGK